MRNTGKESEELVRQALKNVNLPIFDWQRMYDATSARNTFMAQVGDFQWFLPNHHGVIEVKSTKHAYRLSKNAFSSNQRAKLYRRSKAGSTVSILVHHYEAGYWHVVPLDVVYETFNILGQASIDLSNYEKHLTADSALLAVLKEVLSQNSVNN